MEEHSRDFPVIQMYQIDRTEVEEGIHRLGVGRDEEYCGGVRHEHERRGRGNRITVSEMKEQGIKEASGQEETEVGDKHGGECKGYRIRLEEVRCNCPNDCGVEGEEGEGLLGGVALTGNGEEVGRVPLVEGPGDDPEEGGGRYREAKYVGGGGVVREECLEEHQRCYLNKTKEQKQTAKLQEEKDSSMVHREGKGNRRKYIH